MRFDPQSNFVPPEAGYAVTEAAQSRWKGTFGTIGTVAGALIVGVAVVGLWLWKAAGVESMAAAASVLSPESPRGPAEQHASVIPVLPESTRRALSLPPSRSSDRSASSAPRSARPKTTRSSRTTVHRSTSPSARPTSSRTAGLAESTDSARNPKAEARARVRAEKRRFVNAYNAGRSHLSGGRVDQALTLLQQAVQIRPEHADAHYKLGLAQIAAGNPSEARRQQAILMDLDPSLANLLGNLIRPHRARGQRAG